MEIREKENAQDKKMECARFMAYSEKIHQEIHNETMGLIEELVQERHRQNITQKDMEAMTGIKAANLARFESGVRVPTLITLQKYAKALGKKVEIKIVPEKNDNAETKQ